MSTTVRVSAGDKVYAGGTITETTGKDITGATIMLALLTLGTNPDESTTGSLPDDDESPSPSQRTVKMLITDAVAPGAYQLWARITDNPETEWVRLVAVNTI